MTNETKIPVTFWIIGAIAVLWNLMGVGAFMGDIMMSAEALAELPAEQQELYNNNPMWMKIVYGIATITGLLGSIALVMKKGWAVPLFLVSLIGVLIQMSYSMLATNAAEIMGTIVYIMTPLVIIIALFLWYYAKKCASKGWLS